MNLFKIYEKDQYQFYQIPQELFTIPKYKSLSTDAKVLYSILLDRMHLSEKNEWVNDKGEIYLIYSRENVQELLCISDKTCTKAFKELNEVELIKEVRRGLGKPNHIYVAHMEYDQAKKPKKTLKKSREKTPQSKVTSGVVKIRKKSLTRTVKNTIQESRNLRSNKTNINKTNINKDDDDMPFGIEESKSLVLYLNNFKETKTTNETINHLVSVYGDVLVTEVITRMVDLIEDGGELKYPLRYLKKSLVYEIEETKKLELDKNKSSNRPSIKNSLKKDKKLNFNNFETREMYSDEAKMKSLEYKLLGWDKEEI